MLKNSRAARCRLTQEARSAPCANLFVEYLGGMTTQTNESTDAAAAAATLQRDFSEALVKELKAMKEIGMRVPKKAMTMASDPATVSAYSNMRISEAADLLIDLS